GCSVASASAGWVGLPALTGIQKALTPIPRGLVRITARRIAWRGCRTGLLDNTDGTGCRFPWSARHGRWSVGKEQKHEGWSDQHLHNTRFMIHRPAPSPHPARPKLRET